MRLRYSSCYHKTVTLQTFIKCLMSEGQSPKLKIMAYPYIKNQHKFLSVYRYPGVHLSIIFIYYEYRLTVKNNMNSQTRR